MPKKPNIIALITACGRGKRFKSGDGLPKQYLPINNIPILRYTILSFLNNPLIDDIMCIIHPDDIDLYNQATNGLDILDPVFGGETRQQSILKGLIALNNYKKPDKVLIHDAVRPFASNKLINGVIEKLKTHPAVIPAICVEDTIKKIADGKIQWTLERQDLWRAQTPQGFIFNDIYNSHVTFKDLTFTDDAAINEYAGIPVAIVAGSQNNFKITTEEDYERAKKLALTLANNSLSQNRCGIGFDVHRTEESDQKNNKIKLGGVEIEFSKKIIAHSDGDVVIHAVIDSILGALGKGDIGDHFPDNDEKWRNANSSDMLEIVKKLLNNESATIENIDFSIICEEPKISPYKELIKNNLAKILQISPKKINVKATTTEKLGFIGRNEGIACQAVSLININNQN